jgi:two-component system OmpR family sensor kinase
VLASATLIVIFSAILYNYIKISIYEELTSEITKEAGQIAIKYLNMSENTDFTILKSSYATKYKKIDIKIEKDKIFKVYFEQYKLDGKSFLTVNYPLDKIKSTFIYVTMDITNTDKLLNKILQNILVINFTAIFLILFYALLLSRMLIIPINSLTTKLAAMDENFHQSINTKNIPEEFEPLANSINKLVDRIHTFVKYQKELFIGIAHELKTPLAVMKTKNEVTLLKPRESQKYIDALIQNNQSMEEMNKMIGNILEIGRQEGAQFEQPVDIDLIKFLEERTTNFKILAHLENKNIHSNFSPKSFPILIQPTLLLHVLQNFVQNAIKFTPENGSIEIKSFEVPGGITIEVIDDGEGIDEGKDLFAPFKRYGNKSGAGLGLFLAKGAADAIGANINIKNRPDTLGAIATLYIPNSKKKSTK